MMRTCSRTAIAHGARRGYTLVEIVVASGAAVVLVMGLTSTLMITSAALDEDDAGHDRADAVEVAATITEDLGRATGFSARGANFVAFTVPDRDGDDIPESIFYEWSGTPGDPLLVSVNGGTPAPVVEDVQEFGLTYGTNPMSPPIVEVHAGFAYVYPDVLQDVEFQQVATRVALDQPVTLESITVFAGNRNNRDLRVAVYSDNAGEPETRLVESGLASTSPQMQWITVDVPDTALPAGDYWLAVGFEHQHQRLHVSRDGGQLRIVAHDAVTNGFLASWGASSTADAFNLSIYATYHTN